MHKEIPLRILLVILLLLSLPLFAQNSLPAEALPGQTIQVSFFSPTPFPGTVQSEPFMVVASGIPPELATGIDIFGNGFLIASCNASSCSANITPASISSAAYNVSAKGYATDGTYALSATLSYIINSSAAIPSANVSAAPNATNASVPSRNITLPSSAAPTSEFSASGMTPLYTPITPLPVRQYFDVDVNMSAIAPAGTIFDFVRSAGAKVGQAIPQYMAGSASAGRIYAYSENGTLLFTFNSSAVSSQSFAPLGFDIDGDGADDFAIGYPVPNGSAPGSVAVYSGSNGSVLYNFTALNSSFPYFGASVSSILSTDNSSVLLLAGSPFETNPTNASATLFSTARYYLARVSINSTVPSDLADFPARAVFDSSYPVRMGSLWANCSNLQVLDSSMSSPLYYEVENGTCNTNSTVLWVKIPLLENSSALNTIYLLANQTYPSPYRNASAVWSNGYVSVWHGGDFSDSLGRNGFKVSQGSASISNSTSQCAWGKCIYLNTGGALENSSAAAMLPTGNSTHYVSLWGWRSSTSAPNQYALMFSLGDFGSATFGTGIGWDGSLSAWSPGYNKIAVISTNGTALASLNFFAYGQENGNWLIKMNSQLNYSQSPFYPEVQQGKIVIGSDTTYHSGYSWSDQGPVAFDEIRLSDVSRSADWLEAERSQSSSYLVVNASSMGNVSKVAGVRTGTNANISFGMSAAMLGDINGDGYADYAVGDPLGSTNGVANGLVWIFSGSDNRTALSVISGGAGEHFGKGVWALGDIDRDGVSEYGIDSDKYAYVFRGGASPVLVYRFQPSGLGLGNSSICIRPLPDVDNDSYRDFAIISPNASQVGEQVVLWHMFTLNITNTSTGSLPDYSYTTSSTYGPASHKPVWAPPAACTGGCMVFNGSQYIYTGASQPYDAQGSFSIFAWVSKAQSGVSQAIISKADSQSGYSLGFDSSDHLVFFAPLVGTFTSTAAVGGASAHYLGVSRDATTATLKLFIDGVQVGTFESRSAPLANANALYIGANPDGTGGLDGSISEVLFTASATGQQGASDLFLAGVSNSSNPMNLTSNGAVLVMSGRNATQLYRFRGSSNYEGFGTDVSGFMSGASGPSMDVVSRNYSGNSTSAVYSFYFGKVRPFTLVNYSKFSPALTTQFSYLTNLTAVYGLTLGVANVGQISFPQDHPVNSYLQDYDSNVYMGYGFVSVNSSGLDPSFNSTATVSLRTDGVWQNSTAPRVYYSPNFAKTYARQSGEAECTDGGGICSGIQWDNSTYTLRFNVSRFSSYRVESGSNLTVYNVTPLNVSVFFPATLTYPATPVNVTVYRPFVLTFNATDLNVTVTKCDITDAQPIFIAIGANPDYPLNGSFGVACKAALSDPCDMKYITDVKFQVVRPDGTIRLSYVSYSSFANGSDNTTYYSPLFSVDQWSATTPWTCVINVTRDGKTYEQNGTFDSNLDSNLTVAPVPYAVVSGYESIVNLTAQYTRTNGVPQTNANVTFYAVVYGTVFRTSDYGFGSIDPISGNYTRALPTLAPGRYTWYVTAYKRFYMPKTVNGSLLIAGSNLFYSAVPQQYSPWGQAASVPATINAVAGESLNVQNSITCPCLWGCSQSPETIASLQADSPATITSSISVPGKVSGDFGIDLHSSDAQGSNASTSFTLTTSDPQGQPNYQITPPTATGQIIPGSYSPLEFNLRIWPGPSNLSIQFDNPNCTASQTSWQDFSGSSNFVLNCTTPSDYREPYLTVHGNVSTNATLPGWWDSRWKYRRLLDPNIAISGQVVTISNLSVGKASDCSDLRIIAGGGGWAYDMMCAPKKSLDDWKYYYDVGYNGGLSHYDNGYWKDGYREIAYNGSETFLELNLSNTTMASRVSATLELTGTARYFKVNVSSNGSAWTTVLSRVAGVNAPSGGIYGTVQGDFATMNVSYVRFIADVSMTTDNILRLSGYSLENYAWTNTSHVNENPFYKEMGFALVNSTTDADGNHYCSLQAMLTAPKLSNYYAYYGCADPANPASCLTPSASYGNITRLPVLVSYAYNNTVEKIDGNNDIIWKYGNGSPTGPINVLAQPFDASDSIIGTVAIADTLNDRVLVIDPSTYSNYTSSFGYTANNIIRTIGSPGDASTLATPFGVSYYVNYSANGTSEAIYVANTGSASVKAWSLANNSASFSTAYSSDDPNFFPRRVYQSKLGNYFWVADSENDRVIKISSSGTVLASVGTSPVESEQFAFARLNTPYDVSETPEGNVIIADTGNQRVIEVNTSMPENGIVWEYGKLGYAGRGVNMLSFPYSAFQFGDSVFIADTYNSQVLEIRKSDYNASNIFTHGFTDASIIRSIQNGMQPYKVYSFYAGCSASGGAGECRTLSPFTIGPEETLYVNAVYSTVLPRPVVTCPYPQLDFGQLGTTLSSYGNVTSLFYTSTNTVLGIDCPNGTECSLLPNFYPAINALEKKNYTVTVTVPLSYPLIGDVPYTIYANAENGMSSNATCYAHVVGANITIGIAQDNATRNYLPYNLTLYVNSTNNTFAIANGGVVTRTFYLNVTRRQVDVAITTDRPDLCSVSPPFFANFSSDLSGVVPFNVSCHLPYNATVPVAVAINATSALAEGNGAISYLLIPINPQLYLSAGAITVDDTFSTAPSTGTGVMNLSAQVLDAYGLAGQIHCGFGTVPEGALNCSLSPQSVSILQRGDTAPIVASVQPMIQIPAGIYGPLPAFSVGSAGDFSPLSKLQIINQSATYWTNQSGFVLANDGNATAIIYPSTGSPFTIPANSSVSVTFPASWSSYEVRTLPFTMNSSWSQRLAFGKADSLPYVTYSDSAGRNVSAPLTMNILTLMRYTNYSNPLAPGSSSTYRYVRLNMSMPAQENRVPVTYANYLLSYSPSYMFNRIFSDNVSAGPGISGYQQVISANLSFGYGTDTIYQSIHDFNGNYSYYYVTPQTYSATDDFTGRYPVEIGVGMPYDAASPKSIVISTYCTDGCCPNGYTQYPSQLYTFRTGLVYFDFTNWDPYAIAPINVQVFKVADGDNRTPGLYSSLPSDWQQVISIDYTSRVACSGGTCYRYRNIDVSNGHEVNGSVFGYYFATPGNYKTRYYTYASVCQKAYWNGYPYCSCSYSIPILYYNNIHVLGNLSVQSTPAYSNQPLSNFEVNVVPETPVLQWPRGTWHSTSDLEGNFTLPSAYGGYNVLDNSGFGESRNVTLSLSTSNAHLYCWFTYPINGTDNASDYLSGPRSIKVPYMAALSNQTVKVQCYPDYYMTSYSNTVEVSCVDDLGRPCEYNTVAIGTDAAGQDLASPNEIYVKPSSGNELFAAPGAGIVVANQLNRSVNLTNNGTGSLALNLGFGYRSKIASTSNATYAAGGISQPQGAVSVVSASEAYSWPKWSVAAYVNQPVFRWDSNNTYSATELAGTPARTLEWTVTVSNNGPVAANSLNLTIIGFDSARGGYYPGQRPSGWACGYPEIAPFALAPNASASFSFNCTIAYPEIHALPGRVSGMQLMISNLDSAAVSNIGANAALALYNSSPVVQTGTIIDPDYNARPSTGVSIASIGGNSAANATVQFTSAGVIHIIPGANLSIYMPAVNTGVLGRNVTVTIARNGLVGWQCTNQSYFFDNWTGGEVKVIGFNCSVPSYETISAHSITVSMQDAAGRGASMTKSILVKTSAISLSGVDPPVVNISRGSTGHFTANLSNVEDVDAVNIGNYIACQGWSCAAAPNSTALLAAHSTAQIAYSVTPQGLPYTSNLQAFTGQPYQGLYQRYISSKMLDQGLVGSSAIYYVNITASNPILECSPSAQKIDLALYNPVNVTFSILKDVAANVTFNISRPDLCTQANNISDRVGIETVNFTCMLPTTHNLTTVDYVSITMNSSPSYASSGTCSFTLNPVATPLTLFRGKMSNKDVFAVPGSVRDLMMPMSVTAGTGSVYDLNLAANCSHDISASFNESFTPELPPGVEKKVNMTINVSSGSPYYKGGCTVTATDVVGHKTSVYFNVRVMSITSSFAPTSGVGPAYAYYNAFFAGQESDFVNGLSKTVLDCRLGPNDESDWAVSGSSASHRCSFPGVANQTTYNPNFRFWIYSPLSYYAWNASYAALQLSGAEYDQQFQLLYDVKSFTDIEDRGFTCHTVSFAWTTVLQCNNRISWGLSPSLGTTAWQENSQTKYHYLAIGNYDNRTGRLVMPNDTIYYQIDDCDTNTADPVLSIRIQDEAQRQGYGALVCPNPFAATLLVNATHLVNLTVFPAAASVNVDTLAARISSNNTANITCSPVSQSFSTISEPTQLQYSCEVPYQEVFSTIYHVDATATDASSGSSLLTRGADMSLTPLGPLTNITWVKPNGSVYSSPTIMIPVGMDGNATVNVTVTNIARDVGLCIETGMSNLNCSFSPGNFTSLYGTAFSNITCSLPYWYDSLGNLNESHYITVTNCDPLRPARLPIYVDVKQPQLLIQAPLRRCNLPNATIPLSPIMRNVGYQPIKVYPWVSSCPNPLNCSFSSANVQLSVFQPYIYNFFVTLGDDVPDCRSDPHAKPVEAILNLSVNDSATEAYYADMGMPAPDRSLDRVFKKSINLCTLPLYSDWYINDITTSNVESPDISLDNQSNVVISGSIKSNSVIFNSFSVLQPRPSVNLTFDSGCAWCRFPNGTRPVGDGDSLNVTFNLSGLTQGMYEANYTIISDACPMSQTIILKLNVTENPACSVGILVNGVNASAINYTLPTAARPYNITIIGAANTTYEYSESNGYSFGPTAQWGTFHSASLSTGTVSTGANSTSVSFTLIPTGGKTGYESQIGPYSVTIAGCKFNVNNREVWAAPDSAIRVPNSDYGVKYSLQKMLSIYSTVSRWFEEGGGQMQNFTIYSDGTSVSMPSSLPTGKPVFLNLTLLYPDGSPVANATVRIREQNAFGLFAMPQYGVSNVSTDIYGGITTDGLGRAYIVVIPSSGPSSLGIDKIGDYGFSVEDGNYDGTQSVVLDLGRLAIRNKNLIPIDAIPPTPSAANATAIPNAASIQYSNQLMVTIVNRVIAWYNFDGSW